MPEESHEFLTAHLFREFSGRMCAILCRQYGIHHLDTILDSIQDSFESALQHWRYQPLPKHPEGWLLTTARRKFLNQLKRHQRGEEIIREQEDRLYPVSHDDPFQDSVLIDDQLRLLAACCHPRLSTSGQIILTLHILCGFGILEIATALSMKEERVKKILFRAKKLLAAYPDLFRENPVQVIISRHEVISTILYLLFNEGYKTTRKKEGIAADLCYEACRLAKLILPHHPHPHEIHGLLALFFFNISRFPARLDSEECWYDLEEQDRTRWDQLLIKEGFFHLGKARQLKTLHPYYLEALISALHCSSLHFDETPWEQIAHLYELLEKSHGASPFIKLNKIVATAYVTPSPLLIDELKKIEGAFTGYNQYQYLATMAHLQEKMNAKETALQTWQQALKCRLAPADEKYIYKRIRKISMRLLPLLLLSLFSLLSLPSQTSAQTKGVEKGEWTPYRPAIRTEIGLHPRFFASAGLARHRFLYNDLGYASKVQYIALEWSAASASHKNSYALKAGYELNARILALGLEGKYLSNFERHQFGINPRIGLGFMGFVQLMYTRQIRIIGKPVPGISPHEFGLNLQIPLHHNRP